MGSCSIISYLAITPTTAASICRRKTRVYFSSNCLTNLKDSHSVYPYQQNQLLSSSQSLAFLKSNNGKFKKDILGCHCYSIDQCTGKEQSKCDFLVVNFYHFVHIEDPQAEVTQHLSFLNVKGLDIHGRVYFNEQGINAQYSGPTRDALTYMEWIKQDHRFSDVLMQISPSLNGHAFPKLKLRFKPALVQFEGGSSHLPVNDVSMRATPLAPSEWRKMLEAINATVPTSNENREKSVVLLDVRNGYEWDIGHFRGTQRPVVDCFRSTSIGLSQKEVTPDPLLNVDKEKTKILMYCTGGIRCDFYSTVLRQEGFQNLYTLQGGVSNYLKHEGTAEWIGNLFVFDSRLSLPPSVYDPQAGSKIDSALTVAQEDRFAQCYICNSKVSNLRHRNCANLDCNLLFLCCINCVKDLTGCCCQKCRTAPRLRPVLSGHQRYKKWHIYRDSNHRSQLDVVAVDKEQYCIQD